MKPELDLARQIDRLVADMEARRAADEAAIAELKALAAGLVQNEPDPACGNAVPIAQAARQAGVSLDTARRQARQRGKKDERGRWCIDPVQLAARPYRRPSSW